MANYEHLVKQIPAWATHTYASCGSIQNYFSETLMQQFPENPVFSLPPILK